jgi:hypothetical protein
MVEGVVMGVDCTVYLIFGSRLKADVKYEDIPLALIEGHKDRVIVFYDGVGGDDNFIGYVIARYNSYNDSPAMVVDRQTMLTLHEKIQADEDFQKFGDGSVPELIFLPHYS